MKSNLILHNEFKKKIEKVSRCKLNLNLMIFVTQKCVDDAYYTFTKTCLIKLHCPIDRQLVPQAIFNNFTKVIGKCCIHPK